MFVNKYLRYWLQFARAKTSLRDLSVQIKTYNPYRFIFMQNRVTFCTETHFETEARVNSELASISRRQSADSSTSGSGM